MKHRKQLTRQILARCVAFAAIQSAAMVAISYLVFRGGVTAEAVGPAMIRYLLILAGCCAALCAAFWAFMRGWLRGHVEDSSNGIDPAHRDALTGVRNKAAFDSAVERLDAEIHNQTAAFGLVMIDLNDTGAINAAHGHPKGDIYLKNACKLICDTFNHSPVYRVGGDEFVVLLENTDLVARAVLVQRFRQGMRDDPYLDPWERVSAAVGLAVFDPVTDVSVQGVLTRAERAMAENKKLMKSEG